jgi:nucleoside-diphosphate-sugar epimerase
MLEASSKPTSDGAVRECVFDRMLCVRACVGVRVSCQDSVSVMISMNRDKVAARAKLAQFVFTSSPAVAQPTRRDAIV